LNFQLFHVEKLIKELGIAGDFVNETLVDKTKTKMYVNAELTQNYLISYLVSSFLPNNYSVHSTSNLTVTSALVCTPRRQTRMLTLLICIYFYVKLPNFAELCRTLCTLNPHRSN